MGEDEKRYHRAFLLISAITLVMGVVAGATIWFVFRPVLLVTISTGLVTSVLLDLFVSAVVEKKKIDYAPFFYKFFKIVIGTAWLILCLCWAVVHGEIFHIIQVKDGIPLWIQVDLKIILLIVVGMFVFFGIWYFDKNIRLWLRKG